jgi:membrane carboxypeptidase/penicillin-binding protein PbpC
LTIWPSEYEPWARARGLIGNPVAPVTASGPEVRPARLPQPARARVLDIVSPPAGATYLIDPTLRAEFQTVPFRAVAAVGDVEWLVNGQQVGSVAGTRDLHWPLRPGTHRVVARDARGRSAEAQITVR